MGDPIFYDDDLEAWFFWDETWTNRHGPFNDRTDAEEALDKYVKEELDGGAAG